MNINPEYIVVLYSKYSQQCQKILQVYDSTTIDYMKLVCIDNSAIRKRLTTSPSLSVKTVPCVLLVYPGNEIEKFEGSNVTEWVLNQISQTLPQRTELVMEESPQQQQQEEPASTTTSIDDLPEEEETVEHHLPIKKGKSVTEIAAALATERDNFDKPDIMLKRKMAEDALNQFPSTRR